MCPRWSTSWPDGRAPFGRLLLALALLLAPLAGLRPAPAATLPVCSAAGGVRLVPDPAAPALPEAQHCDACLLATPALPVPSPGLAMPHGLKLARLAPRPHPPAPLALPPEQARAPPAT